MTIIDNLHDEAFNRVENMRKERKRSLEGARSWLSFFKERIPSIKWRVSNGAVVTITDGFLHFIVGCRGYLYLVDTTMTIQAGHVFDLEEDWAAQFFAEDPYMVDYIPEWDNRLPQFEYLIQKAYDFEQEEKIQLEKNLRAATERLPLIQEVFPKTTIEVERTEPYQGLGIMSEVIFLNPVPKALMPSVYIIDYMGNWHYRSGDAYSGYRWYRCTNQGQEPVQEKRSHPYWCAPNEEETE